MDLDKLEELARAATPGEWHVRKTMESRGFIVSVAKETAPGHVSDYRVASLGYELEAERDQELADAEYIAAVQPSVILKLLHIIDGFLGEGWTMVGETHHRDVILRTFEFKKETPDAD